MPISLIRPRLTDFHGIHSSQSQVDFAIPFFDEDIPLFVDPFLLWRSPSYQDKSLHGSIVNSFNHLGYLSRTGKRDEAIRQLIIASECDEVGLGLSSTKQGKRIGEDKAGNILDVFERIDIYRECGFKHLEELQLYIDGVSSDRISDIACNFMKSFLIDYTIYQCKSLGIPCENTRIEHLYDIEKLTFTENFNVELPVNPSNKMPILLIPKRWLRRSLWIAFDDYFKSYCPCDANVNPGGVVSRVDVLVYNRDNYGAIDYYIKEKERNRDDCHNDPLFTQIPVNSAKNKIKQIKSLPTGKDDGADKKYEDFVCQLLASLLYPDLDFAAEQVRTSSGVSIRDVVFYNNRTHNFLKEIFDDFGSKQIVMELKNVKEVEREHVDQINRYVNDNFGRFGVLVTRNNLKAARYRALIDLWSGQRKCIIPLTDTDLEQMVDLYESRQRSPLDVLKKKYIEFRRSCPA
ncbi:hypothetical protein DVDV_2266 [Desulfovibrio sp. DV]|uniref:hypothetical protein n=1 Tax=Desulfovibrio sp. DV TaxID=1844708 RepID=UPI000963B7F2|nr:hypothetical protein [Desulfovibrio sp. DV]OLN27137.1 hypothetical protein DVDV_2266 [Desulfovibrio sp. DV]